MAKTKKTKEINFEGLIEALKTADVQTLKELSARLVEQARNKLASKPIARIATWPIYKRDEAGRYVLDDHGNRIIEGTYKGIEVITAHVGRDGKIREKDHRLSSVPLMRALLDPDVQEVIRDFIKQSEAEKA